MTPELKGDIFRMGMRCGSRAMANALVVQGTTALVAQTEARAAQYVRMSTNYQRYSIENQAAVIAAYAQLHGLKIVRTYRDAGESGLKLKNRAGLAQLLDDVQSGCAGFHHILVYDVSRWGRFQDIDESAHYEYLCKRAHVRVHYCVEVFNNDNTLYSTLIKTLKRSMAAEYSRELSAKVFEGQVHLIELGYRQGGHPGLGLRRLLLDHNGKAKGLLNLAGAKHCRMTVSS